MSIVMICSARLSNGSQAKFKTHLTINGYHVDHTNSLGQYYILVTMSASVTGLSILYILAPLL